GKVHTGFTRRLVFRMVLIIVKRRFPILNLALVGVLLRPPISLQKPLELVEFYTFGPQAGD
ncbi:MAG: hypothetical protein WCS37_18905, partial [Chloroflexota bacterium]